MEFLHIDPAVLLNAAAGDGDTCCALSQTYLDITPAMMDKLKAALLVGDKAGIALHAHALKGCTVLVGAAELSAVLARTETWARRVDTPAGPLPALLPAQLADIERLHALVADEVRTSITFFRQA